MLIVLISFSAFIFISFLGALALELFLIAFIPGNKNIITIYQIGSHLITVLLAFPVFLAIHKTSLGKIKTLFSVNKRITPYSLLLYVLAALAAAVIPTIVIKSFMENREIALPDLITGIWMVLIAPIMEEIVFRGFILQKLKKYGIVSAILITTVLFAIGHLHIGNMIISFLPGIVLAILAAKTESILYTVPLHMVINLCGAVILPLVL